MNKSIQHVVNDPEWQALRTSLLGTWKGYPERNVAKLRAYLNDFSDPLRLRRVLNYLTGTGFRLGKIFHPDIDALREEIRGRR